jgi:hypothetical protein
VKKMKENKAVFADKTSTLAIRAKHLQCARTLTFQQAILLNPLWRHT